MAHPRTALALPLLVALGVALGTGLGTGSTLTAQGDYAFQKLTTATFGKPLKLSLTGMPKNKILLVMLSMNGGPTPLGSLFAGDPRSLEVGTDLIALWLYLNSGNGTANLQFTTPSAAALQGVAIHMQTMVGPGVGRVVDKISNKIAVLPGAANTSTLIKAQLRTARSLMSIFQNAKLSSSGGDVVIAGGGTGSILGASGLITSDIFDFNRMTVRAGPNMTVARALATATVLSDGRVLLAGGVDSKGNPTTSAEIYDPATNKFTATGGMTTKRAGHAAALMSNGRVLVAGGASFFPDAQFTNVLSFASSGILRTAEIYDPTTGKWTKTNNLGRQLLGPALTTLSNGKTMVHGGVGVDYLIFLPVPIGLSTRKNCQLFDPTKGTWSNAASMKAARSVHDINTVVLKDGRVLVTGGIGVNISITNFSLANAKPIANAEFYNPKNNTWTSLPNLSGPRTGHTATLLPSGRVIVAGGAGGNITMSVVTNVVQEFNPATNKWLPRANLKTARAGHVAIVTKDGLLMLFGGAGGTTALNSIEAIHP